MSAVGPPGWLQRSLRFVHWLEDLLLTLLLSAMIAIAAAQILLRNLFDWNFSWGDPLTRILVLWVGLLGALAASRSNRHISIDLLSPLLRGRVRALVQAGTALFTAAVCAVIAWQAARFVAVEMDGGSRGPWNLPLWLFQSIMPLGFGLIGLRYALLCLRESLRAVRGDEA
jgi:TRAP-type C4-dicarboxylate transport system permease small subunit